MVDINELANMDVNDIEAELSKLSPDELMEVNNQLHASGSEADEDTGSSEGYPTPPDKDSIFKFFREIIKLKDSSKVGNLSSTEIGSLNCGVRSLQDMALFAEMEGLPQVAMMFRSQAEIVLGTSLSKKGFLAQLFVTQIKKEHKGSSKDPLKISSTGFLGLKKAIERGDDNE